MMEQERLAISQQMASLCAVLFWTFIMLLCVNDRLPLPVSQLQKS